LLLVGDRLINFKKEEKMKKLIALLKRCEAILVTAKAPKSDIKTLNTLINNLEAISKLSINDFYKELQYYFDESKDVISEIKEKPAKITSNIETIAQIYRKIRDNKSLTDVEQERINAFEEKHSNMREFLLGDLDDLYNKISEVGEKKWSMEELKLISFFHFDLKPSQRTNKSDLLNEIKNNIYNLDYMNSMKKQYEKQR